MIDIKILHIKVNANLTNENHEEFKKRIINDLKDGILISDDLFSVEVLEVDKVRIDLSD